MMTPAPLLLFLLIIFLVTLGLIWLVLTAFPSKTRRVLGLFGLWLLVSGITPLLIIALGIGPQVQFPVFACVLIITIGLAVSKLGVRIIATNGLAVAAGFQVFRAPLEYVLVIWHDAGFMPVQLTWHGDNLDVVTGLLALPAAWMIWRDIYPRMIAALFNVIGIYFLCRIVLIIGLSSPTPLRALLGGYKTGPDVLVGMSFPSIWIGAIVVAGAVFLHIASLTFLIKTRGQTANHAERS